MKILIVGGGGREHAIAKKISENAKATKIYALPGNGGMQDICECVDIKATDIEAITEFAIGKGIDFAVVAPDDPLVLGLVDMLEDKGVLCFGPNKNAAILEGSKVFSKDLMKKYNIPTASYEVFDNHVKAKEHIKNSDFPVVIKADGLALGKGVVIATTIDEAYEAINSIMLDKVFGESGANIVIEDFMQGPEVSVLSFTDGKTIVPMISAMDHKRAFDGDKGPNTGGMGTIAPNPFYTEEVAKECMEKIFIPTMNAMNAEERTFKGCIFFGLMITDKGPKVIEYNCRFGDPETQVVLPLLESDLLDVMMAVAKEELADVKVSFLDKSACCVVMASDGYPKKYESGYEITLPKEGLVYVAGARRKDEKLITAGGRVLGVVGIGDDLASAIDGAYDLVSKTKFGNSYYRKDIGKKALEVLE